MVKGTRLRATLNGWILQPAAVIATSHLLDRGVRLLPGFDGSRIAQQLAHAAGAQGADRLELLLRNGVLAGTLEELFFRGLVFEVIRRRWGAGAAILGSAVCFAAAHLDAHQALAAGLLGVQLATLRQVHGLAPAILAHVANNLLAFGSAGAAVGHPPDVVALGLAGVVSASACALLARDLHTARTVTNPPTAPLQPSVRSDE